MFCAIKFRGLMIPMKTTKMGIQRRKMNSQ